MLKCFCTPFYYLLPDQSILSWTMVFNWLTKPTQFQLSLLCYTPNSMLKHTIVHSLIIEQSNPSAPSLNAIMRQTFTKGFSTHGTTLKSTVFHHTNLYILDHSAFCSFVWQDLLIYGLIMVFKFLLSLDRKGVKITLRDGGSPTP